MNSIGNGDYSTITSVAASNLPLAPTNLVKSYSLSSSTYITVQWNSVANVNSPGGNIIGYVLYLYNSTSMDFEPIFNGTSIGQPSQTQFTITKLTPGSNLRLKVSAMNFNGEGALSSELDTNACVYPS